MKKGGFYMKLSGEAYSQRLREYSTSTIKLILAANYGPPEIEHQATVITTDPTLSEAEVRSKLIQLLNSTSTKKETP